MSPLPLPERDKMVKLMQLTQSTNDSEALTAVRKATAVLHRHGIDWERLFNAIDERKIVAWEGDNGNLVFRPHSWAFDEDLDEERIKRELKGRIPKVILQPKSDFR